MLRVALGVVGGGWLDMKFVGALLKPTHHHAPPLFCVYTNAPTTAPHRIYTNAPHRILPNAPQAKYLALNAGLLGPYCINYKGLKKCLKSGRSRSASVSSNTTYSSDFSSSVSPFSFAKKFVGGGTFRVAESVEQPRRVLTLRPALLGST